MIKVVLFDIDGVVLKPRTEFFSEKYSRETGVSVEKIIPFFKGPLKDCVVGKANIREELGKIKDDWEWKGTVDELLDYWYSSETRLNYMLLGSVGELGAQGVECLLASDIDNERAGYLLDNEHLGEVFYGSFFSCDLGSTKEDPEYWNKVKEEFEERGIKPEEVFFWDDDEKNVEVAREAGFQAEQFKDFKSYKERMVTLLEGSSKSPETE